MLFVFQRTSEQQQEPRHQLQNTAVSSDCYMTPEDESSITDNCRQQKDQSVALSNVLISKMNDKLNVDENEDDDMVCSVLPRHSYDVGRKTFSGAGDVVSVQQIDDDTQTQNSQPNNQTVHTHTTEKRYKCDVCQKGFDYRGALKRHMCTHTGEKPFTCDVCHKGCTQRSNLKTHKRTHTGERPYVCDICGKASKSSSDLTKHKWTHSHTKPYNCDVCHMGFVQLGHLKSHMHTHTGHG